MATVTFAIKHGLKVGEDTLSEVLLREPTAGDIIEAQEESEKLVLVPSKDGPQPQFVTSPTLVGVNVLRRQIVRIGNVQGPIDLVMLKRLHPEDMGLLNRKADELEAAMLAEITPKTAGQEAAERGRDDGVGDAPGTAHPETRK
ncbi:phage tail assembly protein [Desulfocurvibacter africanus]|uniref:Mu-like prophage FluMu protein gp41 n=1 Tax=Desulfocurvibacter africanus subsp. africanus str. Walvis Bay TaxID=690850 RepID=F3YW22_DESAF|nr:phage tail assembly protein [Desulfocurvibacter africanus]EGJ49052.1 Mu-like prophage FluMu protein gp41 [Desulfocurvibacter africanus subsp. africanus str. Walvis Bay]